MEKKRNLEEFCRGEPKFRSDPRIISNPSLCAIYNVLLSEFKRLKRKEPLSAACMEDAMYDITDILFYRVRDCHDAEFGKMQGEATCDEV